MRKILFPIFVCILIGCAVSRFAYQSTYKTTFEWETEGKYRQQDSFQPSIASPTSTNKGEIDLDALLSAPLEELQKPAKEAARKAAKDSALNAFVWTELFTFGPIILFATLPMIWKFSLNRIREISRAIQGRE